MIQILASSLLITYINGVPQENPARANGHIFNVGNPHNEVTIQELAELMTDVSHQNPFIFISAHHSLTSLVCGSYQTLTHPSINFQLYCKISGTARPEVVTVDVPSKEFYGVGYDDSDKRIPEMTQVRKQLGRVSISIFTAFCYSMPTSYTLSGIILLVYLFWKKP